MKEKVNILAIYSSPEHHYFTRPKFDVGTAETISHDSIDLDIGRGITGDRFEHATYPLTFISEEVMREVCNTLELVYDPQLFRRNIVISGIGLNALIGEKFYIGEVGFEGLEHCAPCTWMNAVMKKGAYALMSGRGGLRARVIAPGKLRTGESELITSDRIVFPDPLEKLIKPRLP